MYFVNKTGKGWRVRRGKVSLSASVCTGSFEGLVTIAVMSVFRTSSLDEF